MISKIRETTSVTCITSITFNMNAFHDNLLSNRLSLCNFCFTLNQFWGQDTCRSATKPTQTMPEFIVDGIYQWHHTCIHSLTHALQAYLLRIGMKKGVVLTHWLSGMLQPQRLTGPYLPWADCTAWYASVIFVGKKRHRGESAMSQKTGQWHKLASLRFLHDRDYFAWVPWLRKQKRSIHFWMHNI